MQSTENAKYMSIIGILKFDDCLKILPVLWKNVCFLKE